MSLLFVSSVICANSKEHLVIKACPFRGFLVFPKWLRLSTNKGSWYWCNEVLWMKIPLAWQLGNWNWSIMPPPPRHRGPSTSRRPIWIIVLVALVCVSLIAAYIYPPGHNSACYFFSSSVCTPFKDWLPPLAARVLTDEELTSRVVIRDILMLPSTPRRNPKIAFMFLTPGSLPFEKLWEKFFWVCSSVCWILYI